MEDGSDEGDCSSLLRPLLPTRWSAVLTLRERGTPQKWTSALGSTEVMSPAFGVRLRGVEGPREVLCEYGVFLREPAAAGVEAGMCTISLLGLVSAGATAVWSVASAGFVVPSSVPCGCSSTSIAVDS